MVTDLVLCNLELYVMKGEPFSLLIQRSKPFQLGFSFVRKYSLYRV